MFKNYLKVALRNLARYKVFSFINISGLSLGMACSLIILLWVQDERNVDAFMDNSSRLYCLFTRTYSDNKIAANYATPALLPDELKRAIPEIEYTTGLNWKASTFRVGDKIIKKDGREAGEDFFRLFSYTLLQGNAATALVDPVSIAISKKMAADFFGSPQEAIGKTIRMENRKDFKVTAVFDDVPENSSQQFEFVLNWKNFLSENDWARDWTNIGPRTYVLLKPGANPDLVEKKLVHFLDQYDKRSGTSSFRIELDMQRHDQLYLYSNFKDGKIEGGRIEYVRIFSIVAIFILLIACINFMNLATARSVKRAKEISVRKVAGAARIALIAQFIGEAILLAFIAVIIALVLVLLFLPSFNDLTGKKISLPAGNPFFWINIILLTIVTGLIAGSYPALFLSSFNPVKVFKGSLKIGSGVAWFRKGLAVFQFVLCIMLIIGMIVITKQLKYIQSKNLGFNRENLLYIPLEGELANKFQVLKAEASTMQGIKSVSRASQITLMIRNNTSDVQWEGKDPGSSPQFTHLAVGYDFVKTMGITILQGRDFSREFGTDSVGYLVNEEALKLINYKDPIGRPLAFRNKQGAIIGVLKDFHFATVHEPIKPLIIRLDKDGNFGFALIRTGTGEIKHTLAGLEALSKRLNPEFPFTYRFSDDEFAKLYKSELVIGRLSDYFAFLAIFISCLGLLGLAIFTAEQRAREISIRKVLGASTGTLFSLLSKEFLIIVIIAFVIASPIAWFMMSDWLQDYVYRINLSWSIFLLAGLAALGIALVTVSFQSLKAALANPIKSLRSE